MPLPTPEQLNNSEENTLLQEVRRLMKRVAQLEGRANARTNLTNAAGAHVVVGTGNPFNVEDPFTGTAILYPAYSHASGNYHIFGMNAGVLQWGASADNGKIIFGGGDGFLDEYGMNFLNQEGKIAFQDLATGGYDDLIIYSNSDDDLVLANKVGGASIFFFLDDASHNVNSIEFDGDGTIRLFDGNVDLAVGEYLIGGETVFPIQNAESVLGSAFSITGTAGTYQDTGLSLSLPSAGTYRITADVRGRLTGNAGTAWWLTAKLYNSTDAADVTDSERLIVLTATTGMQLQMTCPINQVVTVAAAKTIKLYAARDGTGTPSWTASSIESNTAGRTAMSYEKIG